MRQIEVSQIETAPTFFYTHQTSGACAGVACLISSVNGENYYISLRNSGAKYFGKEKARRFQNFSVCLGNTSAKKLAKT